MSATSVRKLSRKAHADRAVCGTRQRWCWRTKKVGSGEVDDEVVRDAAHLAKRKDERQHGHVACDRRDEQRNVDADERRRLAVRVRVQTITELGHEPPHQPLGVQHLTCRTCADHHGTRPRTASSATRRPTSHLSYVYRPSRNSATNRLISHSASNSSPVVGYVYRPSRNSATNRLISHSASNISPVVVTVRAESSATDVE